jgi:transcriptional regulator with XRE-family HTH domain
MDRSKEIADFLRTRRAALTPERAGLPPDGRVRRVPGLRRDEVARMAGVSTEYFTRLEQGRAANPSAEVVEALARALQLDASEREHLTDLFLPATRASRRAPVRPQRVRPGLYLMLETLSHVPAFILGRRTDVLAANRLAKAVLTDFDALPATKRNLARYYLLDPQARERVGEWEKIAAELTLKSPEFTAWWSDHRVLRRTHGAKHYYHPVAGEMHFSYESFQTPGDPEQTLCVYNVEPGSDSARALQLLGSWTASEITAPAPRPAR